MEGAYVELQTIGSAVARRARGEGQSMPITIFLPPSQIERLQEGLQWRGSFLAAHWRRAEPQMRDGESIMF